MAPGISTIRWSSYLYWCSGHPPAMRVRADKVVGPVRLERPALRHSQRFLRAVRGSRALHRRWVSPPADRDKFAQYVKSLRSGNREGFVVVTGREDIAGVVNVNEIV